MTKRTKLLAGLATVLVAGAGGVGIYEVAASATSPATQHHRYADYLDNSGDNSNCPSAGATPPPGGWFCPTPQP